MAAHVTFGVGLIGLAWWILSCAFKRIPKARLIPRGKALTVREPDELSVLSFNVLSDNLVRSNPHYNYADEAYKSWEYRFDRLKEEIDVMDADIVCLQEIEIEKWSEWKDFMESVGYKGVLLQRKRGPKTGRHRSITNATFFRRWRFAAFWEAHRNRVLALGLKWTDAAGRGHCLCVVNVHLEGHPHKPIKRLDQVKSILETLDKEHGHEIDVVFCGDFSSTRKNAPWKFLSTRQLEGGYVEEGYPNVEVVKETAVHPFALQDAYESAGAVPLFTARSPNRRVEVDFIFCSRSLNVAGVLQSVDPRLIPSVDRSLLPNRLTPSDHLPIGAVMLQPKKSELRNQQMIARRRENQQEMRNESVSSENPINFDMNGDLERSVVETVNMFNHRQKRFLDRHRSAARQREMI